MYVCLIPAYSVHFLGALGMVFGIFSVDNRSTGDCVSQERGLCTGYLLMHPRANPRLCRALTNDGNGGNLLQAATDPGIGICGIGRTWPVGLLSIPVNGWVVWIVRIDTRITTETSRSPACGSVQQALRDGQVVKYTWSPPSGLQGLTNGVMPLFFAPPVETCFRRTDGPLGWIAGVKCGISN